MRPIELSWGGCLPRGPLWAVVGAMAGLAGCAAYHLPAAPVLTETLWAVTNEHQLIKFKADQPGRVLDGKPLQGVAAGDAVVGMDFRVARGVLYVLTLSGRLYTVNTDTGVA